MRLLHAMRRALAPVAAGSGLVAAAPAVPLRVVFRRFWPFARPYRWWLVVALVPIVLGPAIDAGLVWLFKLTVDDVLVPRDFSPFWWIAAAYVGLYLLDGAVNFADDYLSTWIGERFLLALRTHVFAHLHGLSLDVFDRRRLGDLLTRLTGDIAAIEELVLGAVADLLSFAVRIVLFTVLLFVLAWQLALVSLIVVPIFWLLARSFSRRMKQAAREKRRRSGSLSSVAEESLANAALVQAYNRQDHEVARFHREAHGAYAAQMASTRLKGLYTPLINMVELLGGLIVIGFGTWLLSRGELSLGGLLAFMTLLTQLYSPIRGLGRLTTAVYAASAGAERVIELLDERPSVRDPEQPRSLARVRGAIALEGVRFRYPEAADDALRGVTLVAEPGETVALVGASGAGKSTVARLLLRFADPASGRVSLDGVDLRELGVADLRAHVALLLQETLVFHATVRENIAYGRPDASDREIEAAARAADAHEFIAALPDGYDTVVGARGRKLSGGQRQRLAIARAMLRDAPVLVLDEPTTGLDAASAQRVLEPLRRLIEGRTTIVITHSLLTVREADRIVVLDQGEVVEAGRHEELLVAGGAYARLYALHAPDFAAPGAGA